MTRTAPASLDPQLAASALERLELERLTPRAERYFKLLQWLVGLALALTAVYALLRLFGATLEGAQTLAVAAAVAYMLIVPVLALNLEFFNQLRRAGVLKRRLDASWTIRLQRKLADEREKSTLAHLAGIVGAAFAWLTLVFGAIGLVVELVRAPIVPARLALAVVMTSFGVALVLLPRMALGRERLRVIAELEAGLRSGDPSAYDDVARFDRTQNARERERSIKAHLSASGEGVSRFTRLLSALMRRMSSATAPATSYGYRQEPAFMGAKGALTSSIRLQVLAHVDRLIAEAPRRRASEGASPVVSERVEGTDLDLSYGIDHERREIRLISLVRTDAPEAQSIGPTESAGSAYELKLSPSAHASEQALPPVKREAIEEVLGRIAANPAEYERLGTPLPGGQLVTRHPSTAADASVVVTYNVDAPDKTLNVVHVSTVMQARWIIFVSYSHQDEEEFKSVLSFIQPLEDKGRVDIWHDGHIMAGERWRDMILDSLNRCQAALLLVSQHFINSPFIREVELPLLLERAAKGLKLLWVPVRDSTVSDDTKIADFQSLLKPPTISLERLKREGTLNEALLRIRRGLEEALGL
jgi:hypothetical protein